MFSYNTSVHENMKFSPFELICCRIPLMPSAKAIIEEKLEPTYHEYITDLFNKLKDYQAEAKRKLEKSKEKGKYYYDKRIDPQSFQKESFVFLLKEQKKSKFTD